MKPKLEIRFFKYRFFRKLRYFQLSNTFVRFPDPKRECSIFINVTVLFYILEFLFFRDSGEYYQMPLD